MNEDVIKTLGDDELARFVVKAQAEIAARARKRKEDTISKIKELADAAGVSVLIKGVRGRPANGNAPRKSSRAAQAK